mgnify:CR=1 FL=1
MFRYKILYLTLIVSGQNLLRMASYTAYYMQHIKPYVINSDQVVS